MKTPTPDFTRPYRFVPHHVQRTSHSWTPPRYQFVVALILTLLVWL